MKKMLPLFCLGLAACDGSLHGDPRLQRGMTEQEVTELEGKQVPTASLCGPAVPQRPSRFPARFMFIGGDCGWAGSAQRSPSFSRMFEDSGW